ncbi:MAG: DNA-binding protein, partial [Terriglobia bacterium]
MNNKTLFLAWQDKARSRQWFPVGRLDVLPANSLYRFRYVHGAKEAHEQTGFVPLKDFPEFDKSYEASELFPLVQNRVLTPGRKDFQEYLRHLDLSGEPDPVDILSVDGGYRATDSFEVFPKIERHMDGGFCCRFFLHGWRYVSGDAQKRLARLQPDEKLLVAIELTNPVTQFAVQVQTEDYYMIGWAPRYLIRDLVGAIASASGQYQVRV